MSTTFAYNGSHVSISNSNDMAVMKDKLDAGTYALKFDKDSGKFYLDIVEDFEISHTLYGDINHNADRILNTYRDRNKSTGVLMVGGKGMGKSLLLKQTCIKAKAMGIPTILINTAFTGETFNQFIQAVSVHPVVICIDELEKTYSLREDQGCQERLLTLLDGTYSNNCLFLFTSNEKYKIDTHMINRPGRIFYLFTYDKLDEEVIKQYCEDKLNNKDHFKSLIALSKIISNFNFDSLASIIQEMNRYNETVEQVLSYLNIEIQDNKQRYNVKLHVGDFKVYDYTLEMAPLTQKRNFSIDDADGKDVIKYFKDKFNIDLNEVNYALEFTPDDIISFDKDSGNVVSRITDEEIGIVTMTLVPQAVQSFTPNVYKYLV